MIEAKAITYKNGKFEVMESIGGGIESAVKEYATARYGSWLDFAVFHCSRIGIEDEAVDVLNEVILSLLQKDEANLNRLLSTPSKCGKYMEVDILVLRMIKLNVYSATSPYQHKYKKIPVDREVKWERLQIIDQEYEETDQPAIIMKKMRLVRWVVAGLDLTDLERQVFEYYFFEGEAFSQWPGPETPSSLYKIYISVVTVINEVLFYKGLTKFRLVDHKKVEMTKRQDELANQFIKIHKVNTKQTEYSNN